MMGERNLVEGGSATLGLSPLNYISYGRPPTVGTAPLWGGFRGCNRLGACFCFQTANPITYGGS